MTYSINTHNNVTCIRDVFPDPAMPRTITAVGSWPVFMAPEFSSFEDFISVIPGCCFDSAMLSFNRMSKRSFSLASKFLLAFLLQDFPINVLNNTKNQFIYLLLRSWWKQFVGMSKNDTQFRNLRRHACPCWWRNYSHFSFCGITLRTCKETRS